MRVVYRMRGLLGDATEEFIESLDNKTERAVNNEEVYKMANVLAKCDGIKVSKLHFILDHINKLFCSTGYGKETRGHSENLESKDFGPSSSKTLQAQREGVKMSRSPYTARTRSHGSFLKNIEAVFRM